MLEAGGFQSIEAYDVLHRQPGHDASTGAAHAENAAEILPEFPDGLTTAEVAAIMTPNNGFPDLGAAEDSLISLVGDGKAQRQPVRPRRAVAFRSPARSRARRRRPAACHRVDQVAGVREAASAS